MSFLSTISKIKVNINLIVCYTLLIAQCSILIACTGSSEAFIEKAKEQMMKGKAQEALPFLNKAIDKDPTNPKAFNMRGAAYFELKDYVNALLDYEKVMKLDPKDYRHTSIGLPLKWRNLIGKGH